MSVRVLYCPNVGPKLLSKGHTDIIKPYVPDLEEKEREQMVKDFPSLSPKPRTVTPFSHREKDHINGQRQRFTLGLGSLEGTVPYDLSNVSVKFKS